MSPLVDVAGLLDELSSETGLHDFGDPSYRDGLAVLLEAVEAEARLNEIGEAVVATQIRNALATRLRFEAWWAAHPELEQERIDAPIFIVGLSRSGTTALSHLLSRDPANRSLLGWEAAAPVPPPEPASYATDPRFEAARASEFGMLHELNPRIASMHHDPPDMPVECLVTMAQHFVSLSYAIQLPIESYARWTIRSDQAPVYRWHERSLRLLQSGGVRGRWQLKGPQHAVALEALCAQYPDARFIVTHRDPATCVASTSSLARAFASSFSEARDAAEFGALWMEILLAMADGILEFREKHGDARFIDVPYRELTAAPLAAVERIYAGLGETLSNAAESAMRAHVDVAVQHRFGRHDYQWGDFGLDRAALDERFAAYRQRFAEFL